MWCREKRNSVLFVIKVRNETNKRVVRECVVKSERTARVSRTFAHTQTHTRQDTIEMRRRHEIFNTFFFPHRFGSVDTMTAAMPIGRRTRIDRAHTRRNECRKYSADLGNGSNSSFEFRFYFWDIIERRIESNASSSLTPSLITVIHRVLLEWKSPEATPGA